MPLSEDEKRILRQIEQQLEQDPAFSSRGYRMPRRRIGTLTVAAVGALAVAVVGLTVSVWLSVAAVAALFALCVALEKELRLVVRERVGQLPVSIWLGAARRPANESPRSGSTDD